MEILNDVLWARSEREHPHLSKADACFSGAPPGEDSKARLLVNEWSSRPPETRGYAPTNGLVMTEKPKLLAGGNPQIPKGDGPGPVEAYLDAMPGWKQDVGRTLDNIIGTVVPGVQKAMRWNTPFYGLDGQSWFVAFHCLTRYVKVTFFQGASLAPPPPVASKQENVRYFHVHEGESVDVQQFHAWIEQASKLPGEPLFRIGS